ncbi:hypothetical protein AS034_12825 [[Bacillus] enclensis]|uniref:Glyoxalase-like domain-containing protein n=1 Tax=[Bacillus] enclensis TaxID=1402860 RepID=A0A0V8HH23_9BACI|nr:hypothetical protein [[Bacillus] enclensis]KSU61719.1 hypothetical protein AS034_12825 [[Bacillus] enclensis]SCC14285.1 hypothetical protein GA0061094_2655 [[Bacillus] enclensis]
MNLFHYHHWTPKVKEMESYYQQLGFRTISRVGRLDGEMQPFNPPLSWDDFKGKDIAFRIIEMVKGQTNVTFGQGKRDMFDHIGVLLNEEEYSAIAGRAAELGWAVNEGERRTFISTPWTFRIELQRRSDVVSEEQHTVIQKMEIGVPFTEHPRSVARLLNLDVLHEDESRVTVGYDRWSLIFTKADDRRFNAVHFSGGGFEGVDPAGVRVEATDKN